MEEVINGVAEGFFDLLFNLCNTFIDIIFIPFNGLLGDLFSELITSAQIQNFYDVINSYIIPGVGFFVNIIPPLTWNALLIHFTFVIGLYTIVLATHVVLKPLKIVKKIVPFT